MVAHLGEEERKLADIGSLSPIATGPASSTWRRLVVVALSAILAAAHNRLAQIAGKLLVGLGVGALTNARVSWRPSLSHREVSNS